ncbi:hypothetical protein IQ264_09835 [Phormidium sp. LEGE 05292]|uniref:hypothetical protein n=1 Tax=[Phormidium] sp. LEGE 05292 TaxID=767427 RepID=UPI001882C194|nr:hypothetical protein [Phormidium sp. LEGE 05292]MBE9225721.1 hypothetical protein [Phormidium sp. LEGE 05292]
MIEFVVIVESSADARTATKLADRILVEKIDWLEPEQLQYLFRWTGLEAGTEHSCWKDINQIITNSKNLGFRPPRYLGHKDGALKSDGAAAIKIMNLVRYLQKTRNIKAVIFIRDLDNQPERREGLEQARLVQIDRQPKLEIIIGTANRMREAWVLNGFIPLNQEERRILEEIKTKLNFDPCEDSHRLRSNSFEEPDRIRNPKVVVEKLTEGKMEREQQCWEETSLDHLRKRGIYTGLTDYLQEIEQHLTPII